MFRADDLLEREDLASVRLLAPIFSLAARANAKPVLTFTCDLLTHPRQVHRKWNIGGVKRTCALALGTGASRSNEILSLKGAAQDLQSRRMFFEQNH
jgi:hypothetical protein